MTVFHSFYSVIATPSTVTLLPLIMQHFRPRKWGDVRSHSAATRGVAYCGGFYGVFKKGGYGKQSD
jgi:hypothetical protein